MKKILTYGTYDFLHYGHIALLKRAKALGDYLIIGVTSDTFDKNRGKLNVKQALVERIKAIEVLGLADEILVEEYEGQKISDIQRYGADIFAIGSDWEGKFDYLKDYCEVIYLPRTEGVSSTGLRVLQNPVINLGIVGLENPVGRFLKEIKFVNGISVAGIYDMDSERLEQFCSMLQLKKFYSLDELMDSVDAVYIVTTVDKRYSLIMKALLANRHVLCESPLFLSTGMAFTAFQLAKARQLVLFEAVKTLYLPAFERLQLIVSSGAVGSIRDIELSCSQIPNNYETIKKEPIRSSMFDWGSVVLSPIIKLLGTEYLSCVLYDFEEHNFSYFTRGLLQYGHATASFKAGVGIKAEGDMVITGTKGYLYVPAPWWRTEYFEVRYEDLRNTKKYFYSFEGEGLRYEILEFTHMIQSGVIENYKFTKNEMLTCTKVIEQFSNKKADSM